MAILDILRYPDPVLLTPGRPVGDGELGSDVEELVNNMFATMYDAGGVGLAAAQVGVSKRLFVMDCSGGTDPAQKIALINPEIVMQEGEQTGDEGCLSFPGVYTQVRRELRAIVRYTDILGSEQEIDATDLAARCVLHETDHCDGIVFLDRMTALKRELAKRRIKHLRRTGEWN
jgi:peptide deformylase